MTITELIKKLEELKSVYGDLLVCVEDNSRPVLFTEHWIEDVKVYQDIGVFQDFKYCYIIMEDDSKKVKEYLDKHDVLTYHLAVQCNCKAHKERLDKELREFIEKLNKTI